jgi:hypothetical protein
MFNFLIVYCSLFTDYPPTRLLSGKLSNNYILPFQKIASNSLFVIICNSAEQNLSFLLLRSSDFRLPAFLLSRITVSNSYLVRNCSSGLSKSSVSFLLFTFYFAIRYSLLI